MNKIIISLLSLTVLLLTISVSSALCLNCNQLNPQVQYYQDIPGCKISSPNIFPTNFYETQPQYIITQPYSIHPMITYQQMDYRPCSANCGYSYDNYNSASIPTKKCDWHMLFFRSC